MFLARAVLQAAPSRKSKRVREALVGVRDSAEALRAAARERMRAVPRNIQPLDAALDSGWVGLREAIESKSRLGGLPIAARAAKLLGVLFPEGTNFVRAEYRQQWASSQLILERIEEESLTAEIEAITGTDYLPFIRRSHDASVTDSCGRTAHRELQVVPVCHPDNADFCPGRPGGGCLSCRDFGATCGRGCDLDAVLPRVCAGEATTLATAISDCMCAECPADCEMSCSGSGTDMACGACIEMARGGACAAEASACLRS